MIWIIIVETGALIGAVTYGIRMGWKLHDAQIRIAILRNQTRGSCHDAE